VGGGLEEGNGRAGSRHDCAIFSGSTGKPRLSAKHALDIPASIGWSRGRSGAPETLDRRIMVLGEAVLVGVDSAVAAQQRIIPGARARRIAGDCPGTLGNSTSRAPFRARAKRSRTVIRNGASSRPAYSAPHVPPTNEVTVGFVRLLRFDEGHRTGSQAGREPASTDSRAERPASPRAPREPYIVPDADLVERARAAGPWRSSTTRESIPSVPPGSEHEVRPCARRAARQLPGGRATWACRNGSPRRPGTNHSRRGGAGRRQRVAPVNRPWSGAKKE